MFPIVWLPLTDVSGKSNKEPLEVMRTNKGIAPVYKSDVQFKNVALNDSSSGGIFGTNPLFNVHYQSDLSVKLGEKYGATLWGEFSITFHLKMIASINSFEGSILSMESGSNRLEFGTISGIYYIGGNSFDYSIADVTMNKWTAFTITYDGKKLRVYVDKILVLEKSVSYYLTDGSVTLAIHANAVPFSVFDLKVYNEAISMRTILNNYSCLCGHFKFDGTSAEEPQYNPEYDASGFESDMEMDGYATVTSTYSPSRQLSALINSKGTFTIPKHMYFTAWVYIPQSSDTLSDVFRIGDNTVLQMAAGNVIKLIHDDGVGLNWTGVGTTLLNNEDMWYFVSVLYDTIDNRIKCYINGNLELVYDGPISDGSTKSNMSICSGTIISDLRVFINKPTDSELKYLMNREVTIDEKGTVYATELQEVDYMTTFAFGDRGQIMSPSFESPEYTNQKGVMDYDYINNKLSLRDFEEV